MELFFCLSVLPFVWNAISIPSVCKELLPSLQDPVKLFHFYEGENGDSEKQNYCLRPQSEHHGQDMTVPDFVLYPLVGGKRVAICTYWITGLFIL